MRRAATIVQRFASCNWLKGGERDEERGIGEDGGIGKTAPNYS